MSHFSPYTASVCRTGAILHTELWAVPGNSIQRWVCVSALTPTLHSLREHGCTRALAILLGTFAARAPAAARAGRARAHKSSYLLCFNASCRGSCWSKGLSQSLRHETTNSSVLIPLLWEESWIFQSNKLSSEVGGCTFVRFHFGWELSEPCVRKCPTTSRNLSSTWLGLWLLLETNHSGFPRYSGGWWPP